MSNATDGCLMQQDDTLGQICFISNHKSRKHPLEILDKGKRASNQNTRISKLKQLHLSPRNIILRNMIFFGANNFTTSKKFKVFEQHL